MAQKKILSNITALTASIFSGLKQFDISLGTACVGADIAGNRVLCIICDTGLDTATSATSWYITHTTVT